ncbi:MAG: hypothetical protein GY751_03715 [Bacteroidetes bacterium]|nr:hypothetical protein [Bacteroidota bacterium]
MSKKKYDYLASLKDRLNTNEWEIIGYETLWDIVIDLLEKREMTND